MARLGWLVQAALAALAISSVATVQAKEDNEKQGPVSIDEIPAPAREAILGRVGAGTLMEVVEKTGQNGPVYKGRINRGPYYLFVTVDAAGNILELIRGE
jgi:hypothetical protein